MGSNQAVSGSCCTPKHIQPLVLNASRLLLHVVTLSLLSAKDVCSVFYQQFELGYDPLTGLPLTGPAPVREPAGRRLLQVRWEVTVLPVSIGSEPLCFVSPTPARSARTIPPATLPPTTSRARCCSKIMA